jgi:Uma2 family endonuclease
VGLPVETWTTPSGLEIPQRPLTWDDLVVLWAPEDRLRYEVLGGELVWTPTPPVRHQGVLGELLFELNRFAGARELGRMLTFLAVKLGPHDIVVPDLIYVARERAHLWGEAAVEGVPDLIVEVEDERTRGRDRVRKAALYAARGVREYWQVDPDEETVAIRRSVEGRSEPVQSEGDGRLYSAVLPGFVIDPAALFAAAR